MTVTRIHKDGRKMIVTDPGGIHLESKVCIVQYLSASSAISEGAEPTSWSEACAPSSWCFQRHQSIALSPGSQMLYCLLQESTRQWFLWQAASGETAHIRRALFNAPSHRRRQALLFMPGENPPTPSLAGTDRGYYLRLNSTHQCSIRQASSKNVTYYLPPEGTRQCSLCSISRFHPSMESTRECCLCPSPLNELTQVWDHWVIASSPCFAADIPHVHKAFAMHSWPGSANGYHLHLYSVR